MVSQRAGFILGFLACSAAMAVALVFQHVLGLEPCPLCIFQRITVIALGVIFLSAALHNPGSLGRRLYGLLLTLVSLTGIGIAGRHLWLQYMPHEGLSCGPGLQYMLDAMPLQEVLSSVLQGSGDCGEILWSFLGLSIPGWTMVGFLAALAYSLFILFRKTPARV